MASRWERIEKANERFVEELAAWEAKRDDWLDERRKRNAAIDGWKQAYLACAPAAIPDYCKLVLSSSSYPDSFPTDAAIEYVVGLVQS